MPLMGALLAGLIGSLTGFFAKYITKKLAVGAALITVLLSLSVAFWGLLIAIAAGITVAFPSGAGAGISWGLYFVASTALGQMMAVTAATELVVSGYIYQKQGAKMLAYIT